MYSCGTAYSMHAAAQRVRVHARLSILTCAKPHSGHAAAAAQCQAVPHCVSGVRPLGTASCSAQYVLLAEGSATRIAPRPSLAAQHCLFDPVQQLPPLRRRGVPAALLWCASWIQYARWLGSVDPSDGALNAQHS